MIHREARPDPLDTTVEIETPEHVRFRFQVAGPARRAVAYVIDLAVRAVIGFILVIVASAAGVAGDSAFAGTSKGLLLLIFFLIDWAYYVLFEVAWSGRTPGKRALSLRVVTESGHPLRFSDSLLRNLVRAADMLPFGYAIGVVTMSLDPRFRRLGDLVAGTLVVTDDRGFVGQPIRLNPPPTAAELDPLPQRLPLSGEELDAVELFLRRIGKLSILRENELAELVAPIFAERLGLRYRDPTRLLAVLHHRARETSIAPGGARLASPAESPTRRARRRRERASATP